MRIGISRHWTAGSEVDLFLFGVQAGKPETDEAAALFPDQFKISFSRRLALTEKHAHFSQARSREAEAV